MRWQAFVWLHYLLGPSTATPFYACLQSGSANASLSSADEVAEVCAARVGVSGDFARLRDHYVHTWRGAEALAGNAMVQSFHLRRADAEHGPAWPFIQIGQGGYSGPHTARSQGRDLREHRSKRRGGQAAGRVQASGLM